jgi:hypothetical protein
VPRARLGNSLISRNTLVEPRDGVGQFARDVSGGARRFPSLVSRLQRLHKMAKSRFRPRDPDAVHQRFEAIKTRVMRRMDEESSRLVRSQPRGDDHPDASPARPIRARKRA